MTCLVFRQFSKLGAFKKKFCISCKSVWWIAYYSQYRNWPISLKLMGCKNIVAYGHLDLKSHTPKRILICKRKHCLNLMTLSHWIRIKKASLIKKSPPFLFKYLILEDWRHSSFELLLLVKLLIIIIIIIHFLAILFWQSITSVKNGEKVYFW